MKRKYFFFDIDGTLMVGTPGSQYLPDSAKYTLEALRSGGHFVAIATGRSMPMAASIVQNLGIHNVVHDGGYGLTVNDTLVECRPLNREYCLALADECDARGIAWAFSPYNSPERLSRDERFSIETQDIYMKTTVVPGMDPHTYAEVYKMYVAGPPGVEDTLKALRFLPYCRYGDRYFFIEPTDKSIGIRRMLELIGGSVEDVVVFGDARNDLSMFNSNWTSIAMGNGVPELKAKADFVTDTAANDGIYKACLKYHWIEPMP